MDGTVLAYAQWLVEMKQQSSTARYQQQAELDLIRDAIAASTAQLTDLKRSSSQMAQQLQSQVAELRSRMSDAFAEIAHQGKQHSDYAQRTGDVLGGLKEAVVTRHTDRSLAEQVDRLQEELARVTSGLRIAEAEIGTLRQALSSSQEQTLSKFSEVDQALNFFHGGTSGVRQEMADKMHDWRKGQDSLGQAFSALSQEFGDFQRHVQTLMNKAQSDVYRCEDQCRVDMDRVHRLEAQLSGVQQHLYATANEMILLRHEQDDGPRPERMESNGYSPERAKRPTLQVDVVSRSPRPGSPRSPSPRPGQLVLAQSSTRRGSPPPGRDRQALAASPHMQRPLSPQPSQGAAHGGTASPQPPPPQSGSWQAAAQLPSTRQSLPAPP